MGGGGGGRVSWPREVSSNDLLRRASTQEQIASYNSSLNVYLQDLLSEYNARDVESIRIHLDTIASAIEKDLGDSVYLVYGGSVSKHTYVNGLSDVDVLVILNETSLARESPQAVLDYFAGKLQERLPRTEIKIGKLAVTVIFQDGHEIQALPAISTETGVRISAAEENRWSNVVRPERFAQKLTEVNQANSGRVVPVIKLFKTINDRLPENSKLSGYHIESIAINAFENYRDKKTFKDMLVHLSDYSSKAVLNPIEDRTGQSIHVDDYLGPRNSYQRQRTSAALRRTLARMKVADSEASLDAWRELMGD